MNLFVGFRIHEEVVASFAVQVLHLFFVKNRLIDRVIGSKAVFDNGSRAQILEFSLHVSFAFSWSSALEAFTSWFNLLS